MAAHWILKSEPSAYSFADLERDGRTVWDGIRNAQALIHLRAMKQGDRALFYHTGGEKAVVGLATIASDPYPDPKAGDGKLVVVDLVPERALARPISLAAIKGEKALATLGLVRHSRLSVVPVPDEQWKVLLGMGGLP
ncbi:MAG TPA: EVE domain-containing protein [Gemmatimonadales bacterium]